MNYVKKLIKLFRKHNIELAIQNKILLNNIFGIFETDSKNKSLIVKKFGNGAMIPFSKKYLGKRVVVLVVEK